MTNTTLTYTNTPGQGGGNDHIACYVGNPLSAEVKWYDSDGSRLGNCLRSTDRVPVPCAGCSAQCNANGGVNVDPPLNGHTDIHVYTDSIEYVNQDLECRVPGVPSAFIGVYLKSGGEVHIIMIQTFLNCLSTLCTGIRETLTRYYTDSYTYLQYNCKI